jgi:hypothetical protein
MHIQHIESTSRHTGNISGTPLHNTKLTFDTLRGPKLLNLTQTLSKRQYILCSVSPCSPEHSIFLLFIELNNEETNTFWDGELTKQLVNFK